MEEAGCGNRGQVFGGNFQFNRVGGYVTHREDGGVQILRTTAVLVRQRLTSSPAQHQEVKAGIGEASKVTPEGGGGAGSLGKNYRAVVQAVLLFGAYIWVLTVRMMQRLEGEHIIFLRNITRKQETRWRGGS